MRRVGHVMAVAIVLVGMAASARAEVGVLQRSDGSSAVITDLGNGIGIISDSHGNTAPTSLSPSPNTEFSAPQSRQVPSPATPFGSPAPPNQLAPAPVLPFYPNHPLLPAPSNPPAAPPLPPSPSSSGSSMGRFGR